MAYQRPETQLNILMRTPEVIFALVLHGDPTAIHPSEAAFVSSVDGGETWYASEARVWSPSPETKDKLLGRVS